MKTKLRVYVRAAASIVAVMIIAGCSDMAKAWGNVTNLLFGTPALCSATDATLAASRGYGQEAVNFAMANGYYGWCIPEYDDDQRLSDGNLLGKDYGPIAHVLAPPWLDTLHINTTYVQVAILELASDPNPSLTPTPATYTALGLGPLNCIYLRHPPDVGGGGGRGGVAAAGFEALIIPPSSNQKCPLTVAASSVASLAVSAEQLAGTDPQNYPPTTRFIEDGAGRTLIGVRCENQWCAIGVSSELGGSVVGVAPNAGVIPAGAHAAQAGFNYPQATVKGWYDDQMLGIPDDAGKYRILRQVRASAIPDPNLGGITLYMFAHPTGPDPYQTVGHVYFADPIPPNSKYVKTFGFSQGLNLVAMRAVITNANKDTTWFTRVINSNQDTTVNIPTHRMDHTQGFKAVYGRSGDTRDPSIPATMRWRWDDGDEDLWAECDGGCCLAGKS